MHDVEHLATGDEAGGDGRDSICIKDMVGLVLPTPPTPVRSQRKGYVADTAHSHFTSGLAFASYLKGIEAGCAVVDTASPRLVLSAPTESMVAALQETPYDTGLDLERLPG